MHKRNLWIISDVFFPDQVATSHILTEISKINTELFNVNVITGPSNYQSKNLSSVNKLDQDIKIKRINYPKSKNNIFLRLLCNIYFAATVFRILILKLRKSDTVFTVTNPPFLMLVFYFLRKIKSINYILLVHDIFPDNSYKSGYINFFFFNLLNYFFSKFYRAPNKIIVLGNDMKDYLIREKRVNKKNIDVIPNWSDNDIISYRKNSKEKFKKTVVQFAGNHGRVQGLDILVFELQRIKSENIEFNFYGSGAMKNKLLYLKKNFKINCINFFPSFNRSEQETFLSKCDIGLITLMPGYSGLGVPSKTYNLLAAGKPILYVGDRTSEIFRYIQKWDIGWGFCWSELDKLITFFEKIHLLDENTFNKKRDNCLYLANNVFSRDVIIEKFKINNILK